MDKTTHTPLPAHSPLPWRIQMAGPIIQIRPHSKKLADKDDYPIAGIGGDPIDRANAELIVTAVNHHERMVAILRRVANPNQHGDPVNRETADLRVEARAILAELEAK